MTEVEFYEPKIAYIFRILSHLVNSIDMSNVGDKVNDLLDEHIKVRIKSNFDKSFIKNHLSVGHLLKIGLLLLLCFSSFMIKFHYHKKALKATKKYEDVKKTQ